MKTTIVPAHKVIEVDGSRDSQCSMTVRLKVTSEGVEVFESVGGSDFRQAFRCTHIEAGRIASALRAARNTSPRRNFFHVDIAPGIYVNWRAGELVWVGGDKPLDRIDFSMTGYGEDALDIADAFEAASKYDV